MKIAAVGDNCMDVYKNLDQAFPGGNPVNVAVYFKRLGESASYTGAVGTDRYGALMKKALQEKGLDVSRLKVLEGSTAVTQVELIDGERVFGDYDEGVLSQFCLDESDLAFIAEHDLMHTGIWGMMEDYLEAVQEAGVPVSFDFATKLDDPMVERVIAHVDYAFFAYDQDDAMIREFLEAIWQKGPKMAVATLGENGSLAYDGSRFYEYGIISTKVVDTMGAGDSYIAGFMKGVLESKTIPECMELGAWNATETLKYTGAW